MNKPSSDSQEAYINSEEEIAAKLSVFVDNEGEIMYNCDWEPTQEGLIGIASIFYKLLIDDLSDQIFEEVKAQCVSNNTEEDFMAIDNLIKAYSSTQTATNSNDELVVPPDRIMNI
tara:strand:+ start:4546 stop:4893 length:348 start_codon:yes stop_codon:yes gene_type:complete